MELKYIILDGKTPGHKFKDGKGTFPYSKVKDFDNYGCLVPPGYVVLDFDTASDADIMLDIVKGLNIKCNVMKTTRGIHCWFKTTEAKPKNFIKNRLAIGVYADRKTNNNGYVKLKSDGVLREWIKRVDDDDIEVLPKWLTSVSANETFAFKDMGEGSGRNHALYSYVVYLQSKGFSRDEVRQTITIINDYVLADPLPPGELGTILRDESFKHDDVIAEQIEKAKKKNDFSHNEFGDQLIEEFNIITVNGVLYVYEGGYYQADDKIIENKMIELYPSIKQKQRQEVLAYLRIKTHKRATAIKVNPYVLNLSNTRLNIITGELLPFTPNALEFDRIPVTYNPQAYNADVENMLKKVFCYDDGLFNLFTEMLGSILIKHNRYHKGFLLTGTGSNGKSTIVNMLQALIGVENYITMDINQITSRFGMAMLENKLANFGDDINNEALKDTGTLKKMFAGNRLQVEHKGGAYFQVEPYATHIYTANDIPRSYDKTDGFYRRWVIIPFNAHFSPLDADFDPMIEDKVTTPEALAYLLNLGITGAQMLIKNGKYTEVEQVTQAIEEYKKDNSTILSWIDDARLDLDYFVSRPKNSIYSDFVDWCKLSGVKPGNVTGKKNAFKEICQYFDLDEKAKQKSDRKYYLVVKI